VTLPEVIGRQRATELLYTGRVVRGPEALEIGLCDRLVEPAELRSAARGLAAELAESAPLAVRSIRRTMRGDLAERVAVSTAHELNEQERLKLTADFREGLRASAERRDPVFKGR
jgi:enoyl-CoA hydratase/carnithine racemase